MHKKNMNSEQISLKKYLIVFLLLAGNSFCYAKTTNYLDGIEAIVNKTPILTSEVDAQLAIAKQKLRQMQMPIPADAVLRKDIIEQVAVEESILAMAEKVGIKVSDEEFMLAIENISKNAGISIAELKRSVREQGLSFERYREDLIAQLTISKLQQLQVANRIQITDLEVEDFLQTNEGAKLDNREFRLGHLLIEFPEGATAEQIQLAHKTINDIKDELMQGRDFATLARKYSYAGTAESGGDLGWQKIIQMPRLFANQVGKMQVGDIVGPLKSSNGLHLIKLQDKRYGEKKLFRQYKFNRILLEPNKLRNDTSTLNLAKLLVKKLNANASFYDLAKEYSDDFITKQKGGFTDWILEQALPKEILKDLQNLAKNAITPPLKTERGWEIWQKLDTKNIDLSEDMLKNQVRELLFRKKFVAESQIWLNKVRQNLFIEYKRQ